MFTDIRKSLSSALYERTTSPFYGSLIITWCLWNWSILYLLFWDESKMCFYSKLNYVNTELFSFGHFIFYPLLSTVFVLTVGNVLSSGAYWLQLYFDKWRAKKKESYDSDKRLTIEESLSLRREILEQQKSFRDSIEMKESEIELLHSQLNTLISSRNDDTKVTISEISENEMKKISDDSVPQMIQRAFKLISKTNRFSFYYSRLLGLLRNGNAVSYSSDSIAQENQNWIPNEMITILENFDIIEKTGNHSAFSGYYKFTDFGKEFNRFFLENYNADENIGSASQ